MAFRHSVRVEGLGFGILGLRHQGSGFWSFGLLGLGCRAQLGSKLGRLQFLSGAVYTLQL